MQESARCADLPAGHHSGSIQDLSGTRDECGAFDLAPGLLLPERHRIVQRLNEHHAVEQIIARGDARAIDLDQIDRPPDNPWTVRKRGPPLVRPGADGPSRCFGNERSAAELFLEKKGDGAGSGLRPIDTPATDTFSQQRFDRLVQTRRHEQPFCHCLLHAVARLERRRFFIARPAIAHVFPQHSLECAEMRIYRRQFLRLPGQRLLDGRQVARNRRGVLFGLLMPPAEIEHDLFGRLAGFLELLLLVESGVMLRLDVFPLPGEPPVTGRDLLSAGI